MHGDEEPAAGLLAAMVAELVSMYGPLEERGAPTANPEELEAPHGTYLVLFEDGQAVAGGGIKPLGDRTGEIKRMYVAPEARGRGHARRLLCALEQAGRALGLDHLRLDTGPKQPFARALYESAGYRSIPSYNANHAASFWGEKRLDTTLLFPRADPDRAQRLLELQRAAYAAEAELLGFDGIPPLHETLEELLATGQRWLGRFTGTELVGALAWEEGGDMGPEISRLVVAPAAWRSGHATALLDAFDPLTGGRPVRVATGSDNAPALALYARRGFAATGEEEIAPGVGLTRLLRAAGTGPELGFSSAR